MGYDPYRDTEYTLSFSSSKCSLFHNSNIFGSRIIHILYTECAKIKKNNSGAKKFNIYQAVRCHNRYSHSSETPQTLKWESADIRAVDFRHNKSRRDVPALPNRSTGGQQIDNSTALAPEPLQPISHTTSSRDTLLIFSPIPESLSYGYTRNYRHFFS